MKGLTNIAGGRFFQVHPQSRSSQKIKVISKAHSRLHLGQGQSWKANDFPRLG